MKVLVTGGSGYIGSVAVEKLLIHGHEVSVIDNLWQGHSAALPSDIRLYDIDLRDAAAVAGAVKEAQPAAVMHFAAMTIVPESVERPVDYFGVNVVGTHNLLAGVVAAGVSRFVFSSTAAVYGVPETVPIPESAPLAPINPYGVSKLIVEQMLPAYERAYGLCTAVFRYFNVAGATRERGEDHHPETHVIPIALDSVLGRRGAFKIFGTDYSTPDGTAIRDYLHVVDLVDAHLAALDKLDRPLGAFNLGSKSGFSVRQIADAVERVTGRELPVEEAPRRAGDPPILVADSSRANDILGWRPSRSSLDEMIGSTWEWMQSHPAGYGRE